MNAKKIALFSVISAAILAPLVAVADDWKDESGKGHGYRGQGAYYGNSYDRYYEDRKGGRGRGYDYGYGYAPRIPDGHLPPPGECRVWYPDRPAGHQPPPLKC